MQLTMVLVSQARGDLAIGLSAYCLHTDFSAVVHFPLRLDITLQTSVYLGTILANIVHMH